MAEVLHTGCQTLIHETNMKVLSSTNNLWKTICCQMGSRITKIHPLQLGPICFQNAMMVVLRNPRACPNQNKLGPSEAIRSTYGLSQFQP